MSSERPPEGERSWRSVFGRRWFGDLARDVIVAVVAGVFALGIGVLVGKQTASFGEQGEPAGGAVSRGAGDEPLDVSGTFAQGQAMSREFHAKSALVFATELGLVLRIFEDDLDCASGDNFYASSDGLAITVTIDEAADAARTLPIGVVLDGVTGGFSHQSGNRSMSWMDPLQLRVTAIDTAPGGLWRGDLNGVHDSSDAHYEFAGTFAAKWCAA